MNPEALKKQLENSNRTHTQTLEAAAQAIADAMKNSQNTERFSTQVLHENATNFTASMNAAVETLEKWRKGKADAQWRLEQASVLVTFIVCVLMLLLTSTASILMLHTTPGPSQPPSQQIPPLQQDQ